MLIMQSAGKPKLPKVFRFGVPVEVDLNWKAHRTVWTVDTARPGGGGQEIKKCPVSITHLLDGRPLSAIVRRTLS